MQQGSGTTHLELGSMEHTLMLLGQVATELYNRGIPWDPFNVSLVVWAQHAPIPVIKFYKPSDL